MISDLLEALGPGHWIAECIMEIVSYVILGRLLLKWHDRKEHSK